MRILSAELTAICVLACITACTPPTQTRGEVVLPEGDAAKGEMHFVSLGCTSCHTVVGAELPEPALKGPVRVVLGTRTGRTLSYGQLVTSIVNPSHRLASRYREEEVSVAGQSLMAIYNDIMTVRQLTDIVAFLQEHYEKADRPGYKYPVYTYGDDDEGEESGSPQPE